MDGGWCVFARAAKAFTMKIDEMTGAKLAAAYAGAVFGIYWIPIRVLSDNGFEGLWSSLVFLAVPAVLLLPVGLYRIKRIINAPIKFYIGTLLAGFAFTMYATSYLYTEVIRVALLFYLLPIWGFLLGWAFLGERITAIRWVSMALGILGMLVIFDIGVGFPVPRNIGDWMALIGGICWAVASLVILTEKRVHAVDYTLGFFFWAGILMTSYFVVFAPPESLVPPTWAAITDVAPWILPVLILVVIPGGFATIYAPTKLNPGVAGLLFLTEISIAAVSAALWANEPFGTREILGVLLISGAAVFEPITDLFRTKRSLPPNSIPTSPCD
jgi:drug/metabolite transporter (DMT)-like permease